MAVLAVLLLGLLFGQGLAGKNESTTDSFELENAQTEADVQESRLTVHFLDVGQGASTLLVCDGEAMLIDGGGEDTATFLQLYLKKQNIDRLKYVVATHPDADHIGGLDVILYKFPCGEVLSPGTQNDTAAYRNYLAAIESSDAVERHPKTGEQFTLGSAVCTVLGPTGEYNSGNDNSLVLLVQHGRESFLFEGDAEKEAENDLAEVYRKLRVDVLLAAHHGSRSSSTSVWLKTIRPRYTVISCGRDNREGHPHEETLERLQECKTKLFRTDLQGTLLVQSDGESLTWSQFPAEDYTPGTKTANETAEASQNSDYGTAPEGAVYIGNMNSMKLHRAECDGLPQSKNQILIDTLEEAVRLGFTEENQCKRCRPFEQQYDILQKGAINIWH